MVSHHTFSQQLERLMRVTDSSDNASQNGNQPENHGGMMTSGDFTITGVNTTDNVSDFTSGKSTISKGDGITSETADNCALISSDLASENSLSVGIPSQ